LFGSDLGSETTKIFFQKGLDRPANHFCFSEVDFARRVKNVAARTVRFRLIWLGDRPHLRAAGMQLAGITPLSQPEKIIDVCCKNMATAMSFPSGRHFFIEDGVLKLTVPKTPVQGGEKPCWSIPFASALSAASRYQHSRHDRHGGAARTGFGVRKPVWSADSRNCQHQSRRSAQGHFPRQRS
jgi:hypothetical protein